MNLILDRITFKTDYINDIEYNSINADLKEILKLLTSIIKTSKLAK